MSNYIYTNGELINVDSLSHADFRRQAANAAKTAYLSTNRTVKESKRPRSSFSQNSHSSGSFRSKGNSSINAMTNVPDDIKPYISALLSSSIISGLHGNLSSDDIEIMRAIKNAGITPQDLVTLMIGSVKDVPAAARKIFNLSLFAQKYNK